MGAIDALRTSFKAKTKKVKRQRKLRKLMKELADHLTIEVRREAYDESGYHNLKLTYRDDGMTEAETIVLAETTFRIPD
jgi:hypothetical protein